MERSTNVPIFYARYRRSLTYPQAESNQTLDSLKNIIIITEIRFLFNKIDIFAHHTGYSIINWPELYGM